MNVLKLDYPQPPLLYSPKCNNQALPTTRSNTTHFSTCKLTWTSCLCLYIYIYIFFLFPTPGEEHLCTHLSKLPNLPFLCGSDPTRQLFLPPPHQECPFLLSTISHWAWLSSPIPTTGLLHSFHHTEIKSLFLTILSFYKDLSRTSLQSTLY